MGTLREEIKDKKRIVIKIGSSSLQHKETGGLYKTGCSGAGALQSCQSG